VLLPAPSIPEKVISMGAKKVDPQSKNQNAEAVNDLER
jgi:hypothetical protein